MKRPATRWIVLGVTTTVLVWVLFFAVPRWYGPRGADQAPPAAAGEPAPTGPVRKITATLFFISSDGLRLVPLQREVPYGEGTAEQARRIVEEQLKPGPETYLSALPPQTELRGLYLTDKGDAFVDLSNTVVTAHTGGSLDELFAVYAIVNALTVNLPAVKGVQILVEGKEVDTLAGHVDMRHPLQKNLRWTGDPNAPAPPTQGAAPTVGTEPPKP